MQSLRELYKIVVRSLVHIEVQNNGVALITGAGFVVGSFGRIVSCAHVVAGRPNASVIMVKVDDYFYLGSVLYLDHEFDLVLLQIAKTGMIPITLQKEEDFFPGDEISIYGSPAGVEKSMAVGHVANVGNFHTPCGKPYRVVQTDANMMRGFSGGPMCNCKGEVIGICTSGIGTGIGYALAIKHVSQFLKKFEEKYSQGAPASTVCASYIGWCIKDIPTAYFGELRRLQRVHPDVDSGIAIVAIFEPSPAQQAGLEVGDILTEANDKAIFSVEQMYALSQSNQVNLVVYRRPWKRLVITLDLNV